MVLVERPGPSHRGFRADSGLSRFRVHQGFLSSGGSGPHLLGPATSVLVLALAFLPSACEVRTRLGAAMMSRGLASQQLPL